ncbi:MAG: hypothetical protein AAF960_05995 [Bacteroidota bacterium]
MPNFLNQNKLLFLLFLCLPCGTIAQISPNKKAELDALNNYLHFTNESIHGLLTVHRLLETFNQKVNKYVDLESNQLNFYSNADLPANIFEDPENWFYDTSPLEWYDKAAAGSKHIDAATAGQLNLQMQRLKEIINRVNAIRFDLEKLTLSDDLKERKNLVEIYAALEQCVQLYDDFNATKKKLKNVIQKRYLALGITQEEQALTNLIAIHENIRAFLEGVLSEEATNLVALTQHIKNNLATAESFNVQDRLYKNVLRKADAFNQVAQKYLNDVAFPAEYKLYGKTYYYYNVEMVAKFNRYGSGLVSDLNKWMSQKRYLSLVQLEEPHFFKVIYPKRELPKVDKVASIKPNRLPSKLDDRAVVVKQKSMVVSPGTITISVYDHQLADGDIISLNYNGHWILENYQLRRRARKLTLPLRPSNDNYLILHAVNLGNKPPNTVTLAYDYKGEVKNIVMESDMNTSEMIKIDIR